MLVVRIVSCAYFANDYLRAVLRGVTCSPGIYLLTLPRVSRLCNWVLKLVAC
jgi:hypothetical protein